jgi:hypothetical protein
MLDRDSSNLILTPTPSLPLSYTGVLSTDSFVTAGLHIDAFDFGETSEWMLDDFWFLNEALDVDAHAQQLF